MKEEKVIVAVTVTGTNWVCSGGSVRRAGADI
jgi:hypothetical protein